MKTNFRKLSSGNWMGKRGNKEQNDLSKTDAELIAFACNISLKNLPPFPSSGQGRQQNKKQS